MMPQTSNSFDFINMTLQGLLKVCCGMNVWTYEIEVADRCICFVGFPLTVTLTWRDSSTLMQMMGR
jgi:hypothetical protein